MKRGRPLNNIDPEQASHLRQQMREVREALKMTVPHFAALVGMVFDDVANRERGRAGWRHEEIAQAKIAVKHHVLTVFEKVDALPF